MSFDEENVDNNFMGNIYNITLKLQTNSSNNSFSIRKIEPSKLHTFHFFLWKVYCFFLTLITPSSWPNSYEYWLGIYVYWPKGYEY